MRDYIRERLSDYWSSVKHKSVYGWPALFALSEQQITIVCSPLSIKLVEITRSERRSPDEVSSQLPMLGATYDSTIGFHEQDEGFWCEFIRNPRRLVECIKQYHCAGNIFFVAMSIQLATVCYLGLKTAFHKYVTGSDKALAVYYADWYFPRLFHTYSDTHFLDSQLLNICIFILFFRLSRLYSLIKNSINNRKGYRYIFAQQASFSAATAFKLSLEDWTRFWHLVYNHRRDCIEDADIRRSHRSFDYNFETLIRDEDTFESIYFNNLVSFEQCYSTLQTRGSAEDRTTWARDRYVPEPIMRMDPYEFSWLLTIFVLSLPLTFAFTLFVIIAPIIYELCAIAHETNQDSCLMQAPVLLASLSRMIRILDLFVLLSSYMAPQVEGATFYWDCCIMISRARKVREALQEDIELCAEVDQGSIRSTRHNVGKLRAVDNSIRLHIRLAKYVYQEFRDLRVLYAVYLNIILIGGGILLSMIVKEIIVTDSLFKVSVLYSFIFACGTQMGLSIFFCIFVESTVSITNQSVCWFSHTNTDWHPSPIAETT